MSTTDENRITTLSPDGRPATNTASRSGPGKEVQNWPDQKSGPAPSAIGTGPETSSTPYQYIPVSPETQSRETGCPDVRDEGVHDRSRSDAEPPQQPYRGQSTTCADRGADASASPDYRVDRQQACEALSPKYRRLFERAWSGKSRKAAIRSQCLQCCGFSPREVRRCSDATCPLFEFRREG